MKLTPSQTAGPYVHIGCLPSHAGPVPDGALDPGRHMIGTKTPGERMRLAGRVLDGAGDPLEDALIEFWQADARGRYRTGRSATAAGDGDGDGDGDDGFRGWARRGCAAIGGEWQLDTVRPGRVHHVGARPQAPHIALWIVARGINVGLHTRLYFAGDPANEHDPVLSSIEPRERRDTLLATLHDGVWRFDVNLQGVRETVFFDV